MCTSLVDCSEFLTSACCCRKASCCARVSSHSSRSAVSSFSWNARLSRYVACISWHNTTQHSWHQTSSKIWFDSDCVGSRWSCDTRTCIWSWAKQSWRRHSLADSKSLCSDVTSASFSSATALERCSSRWLSLRRDSISLIVVSCLKHQPPIHATPLFTTQ